MLGVEGRMGLISGPILGGMLESVIFTLIFGNSVYSIVNLNIIVLYYKLHTMQSPVISLEDELRRVTA